MKKVIFEELTDEQRESFVEGFQTADDIGVDDWDSATPWGAPWFWTDSMEAKGTTPEEWGKEWFEKNRGEISELKAEQEAEEK